MKILLVAFWLSCLSFVFLSVAQARPTYGKKGLVVSASDLASQAGIKAMQAGGNAADAAVATYFVLSVTRPYYASLGGGGLMLVRFSAADGTGEINALDFREKAPHKASREMYIGKSKTASEIGGLAVATPGNVAGLYALHKKYGKLAWATDLASAIEIANKGFIVTEEFARITNSTLSDFTPAGKKYFTLNGKPLSVGDRFVQPQLATALEIIQKEGAEGFYKKSVAQDVIRTLSANGGLVDADDLNKYEAQWTKPLHASAFGAEIFSMPPPSSGGALLLAELKMSDMLKLTATKPGGAGELHIMAEIMTRVFFDRQYIADPKYTSVPIDQIYKDERLEKWTKTINKKKKTSFDPKNFQLGGDRPSAGNQGAFSPREKECTTHFSVVDKDQNAVSLTTTINGEYGSAVVTEQYGIVLNNEMDDFTTRPGEPNMFGLTQGKANEVAPLKTPLSSMTPTIVEKAGQLFLVIGSPGGPKIINAVYQTTYHALTTPLNLDEVIQLPRVHEQFKPDQLYFDPTLSPDTQTLLEKMGHHLTPAGIARVYGIRVNPAGLFEGAFDSRGEGGASGY